MSYLSLLTLLAAGPAHAWQAPLHLTTYSPGPHTPEEPVNCTYTHDDGESFTGTITSDGSGGLVCDGIAEPTQDAAIEADLADQDLVAAGDCAVVAEGSANLDEDPALTRAEDLTLNGQSLAVYCDNPHHTSSGESVLTASNEESVTLTIDAHENGGHLHEVIVTQTELDPNGELVESELDYRVLTPDESGQLTAEFPANEGQRFKVNVRPIDTQGFALPLAEFQTTDTGFEARVRGLQASVEPTGVTVGTGVQTVTFRLDRWGRDGHDTPAQTPLVTQGDCIDAHPELPEPCVSRVELQRDGIQEFWQTLSDGFEQGWTLQDKPAGTGELYLDVTLQGAIDWVVDADGSGAQVRTSQGTVLRYEQLVVFDANGSVVPAQMQPTESGLRIAVPSDEGAQYPLTVDPLIKTIASAKKKKGVYTFVGPDGGPASSPTPSEDEAVQDRSSTLAGGL